MNKIKTIFKRDWDGNRGVIDEYDVVSMLLVEAPATEKLDGTNIRVTIRNNQIVRMEKRCNPSKKQKVQGILDPWYKDVDEYNPEDKYIVEAIKNREYKNIRDGEWSGEAVGPKIQGNPLNLEKHTVCLFSVGEAPVFENVPITYNELKEWLPKQKSKFGNNCGIEGIVWHIDEMFKIKTKDFKN